MTSATFELTVNGVSHIVSVPARTMLADVIRDRLKLTGTHIGCEHGVCGACTVFIDGLPSRSCITLAASCMNSDIITVEGLRGAVADKLRDSFKKLHALQCGFCTPGMLVSALDILARRPNASETEIREELSGNLCRCTGYAGIVDAIKDAASKS